jgi:hypothetical protein
VRRILLFPGPGVPEWPGAPVERIQGMRRPQRAPRGSAHGAQDRHGQRTGGDQGYGHADAPRALPPLSRAGCPDPAGGLELYQQGAFPGPAHPAPQGQRRGAPGRDIGGTGSCSHGRHVLSMRNVRFNTRYSSGSDARQGWRPFIPRLNHGGIRAFILVKRAGAQTA